MGYFFVILISDREKTSVILAGTVCRLYGFRSAIHSGVHQSLVAAENALAEQSKQHSDGWGIAYYIGRVPHLIKNDEQALQDTLFREVSAVVSTRTFMAHIRKATVGNVRVLNCHPFQFGTWTLAHNGEIHRYNSDPQIKNKIRDLVDPRFRRYILGDTDSEVCSYIFLSYLARVVDDVQGDGVNAGHATDALRQAVAAILAVSDGEGEADPTRLTFLLTNGTVMIGYRFRKELFYTTYKTICPERDSCYAYEPNRCEQESRDGIVKHLIIASEVLGGPNVWKDLADDEYVRVDHGMNYRRGTLGAYSS